MIFNQAFRFDRNVPGQHRDANCGPGGAADLFSEDTNQKLACAVCDRRLLAEIRRAGYKYQKLDKGSHSIQISQCRFDCRQDIQNGVFGSFFALLQGDGRAEFSVSAPSGRFRPASGNIQKICSKRLCPYEYALTGADFRQCQPQGCQIFVYIHNTTFLSVVILLRGLLFDLRSVYWRKSNLSNKK